MTGNLLTELFDTAPLIADYIFTLGTQMSVNWYGGAELCTSLVTACTVHREIVPFLQNRQLLSKNCELIILMH